jgi:hypothetical protein
MIEVTMPNMADHRDEVLGTDIGGVAFLSAHARIGNTSL